MVLAVLGAMVRFAVSNILEKDSPAVLSPGVIAADGGQSVVDALMSANYLQTLLIHAGGAGINAEVESSLRHEFIRSRVGGKVGHRIVLEPAAGLVEFDLARRIAGHSNECVVLVERNRPFFDGKDGVTFQADGGRLPAGVCLY